MDNVTSLTTSRSATAAAELLKAWHEDNRELLAPNAITGYAAGLGSSSNSYECERLELLDGITTQIRSSLAYGRTQDANVYIPLLRHLAEPAVVPFQ